MAGINSVAELLSKNTNSSGKNSGDTENLLRSIISGSARRRIYQTSQQLGDNQKSVKTNAERKTTIKPEPNLGQSEAKPKSNPSQSEAKVKPNLSQSEAKLSTKLKPQPEPNISQSEAKLEPNLSQAAPPKPQYDYIKDSINSIGGLQLKIVMHIYSTCSMARTKQTPPMTISSISTACYTTVNAARKAIQRLAQKEILYRVGFKNGKGGWTIYELSDAIYQEILHKSHSSNLSQSEAKLESNLSQSEAKLSTKLSTKLEPSPSSSSSITNINTTTGLNEEFSQVQIPDVLRTHQFGVHVIKQVQDRGWLKSDQLQESLDAFSFDVLENQILKKKNLTSAVGWFMASIKNGNIYQPPSNYKSDADKALEEQSKRLKALQAKRQEQEKILEDLAFEEWLAGLKDDEKLKLAKPFSKSMGLGTNMHNAQLRGVWKKQHETQASQG